MSKRKNRNVKKMWTKRKGEGRKFFNNAEHQYKKEVKKGKDRIILVFTCIFNLLLYISSRLHFNL